ncbi:MAG: DUF3107 domain-containing protein [bacterium]|nr:DUF3107 domain-containing protein [bacterium]
MRARIGIADTGREIEVEVGSRDEIVRRLEGAYDDGVSLLWFQDAKGRDIGVPLERIAFVELVESPDKAVGFGR